MRQYSRDYRPPAVEQTNEAIIRYLQDEGLKGGDRLPKERDLGAQPGVGRSTLRATHWASPASGVCFSRKCPLSDILWGCGLPQATFAMTVFSFLRTSLVRYAVFPIDQNP